MITFMADVSIVHYETWIVEADDAKEARVKILSTNFTPIIAHREYDVEEPRILGIYQPETPAAIAALQVIGQQGGEAVLEELPPV